MNKNQQTKELRIQNIKNVNALIEIKNILENK